MNALVVRKREERERKTWLCPRSLDESALGLWTGGSDGMAAALYVGLQKWSRCVSSANATAGTRGRKRGFRVWLRVLIPILECTEISNSVILHGYQKGRGGETQNTFYIKIFLRVFFFYIAFREFYVLTVVKRVLIPFVLVSRGGRSIKLNIVSVAHIHFYEFCSLVLG